MVEERCIACLLPLPLPLPRTKATLAAPIKPHALCFQLCHRPNNTRQARGMRFSKSGLPGGLDEEAMKKLVALHYARASAVSGGDASNTPLGGVGSGHGNQSQSPRAGDSAAATGPLPLPPFGGSGVGGGLGGSSPGDWMAQASSPLVHKLGVDVDHDETSGSGYAGVTSLTDLVGGAKDAAGLQAQVGAPTENLVLGAQVPRGGEGELASVQFPSLQVPEQGSSLGTGPAASGPSVPAAAARSVPGTASGQTPDAAGSAARVSGPGAGAPSGLASQGVMASEGVKAAPSGQDSNERSSVSLGQPKSSKKVTFGGQEAEESGPGAVRSSLVRLGSSAVTEQAALISKAPCGTQGPFGLNGAPGSGEDSSPLQSSSMHAPVTAASLQFSSSADAPGSSAAVPGSSAPWGSSAACGTAGGRDAIAVTPFGMVGRWRAASPPPVTGFSHSSHKQAGSDAATCMVSDASQAGTMAPHDSSALAALDELAAARSTSQFFHDFYGADRGASATSQGMSPWACSSHFHTLSRAATGVSFMTEEVGAITHVVM